MACFKSALIDLDCRWANKGQAMQMTKRDFIKKRSNKKEATHMEGKFFCDCRVRNFRKWLGVKLYGQPDRLRRVDILEIE